MKNKSKRDDILKAALELITERGFHGAPMAMLAKKAGIAAGTIYIYFESKDALIDELYRELEDKLIAAIMAGYPIKKSIKKKFLHIGTAVLKYFIANPLFFRYLEQYHNSPYGVSVRRDHMQGKSGNPNAFRDIIEEGISQKVLKDLPINVHFALAFGPILTVARDHVLGLAPISDSIIVKTIEACWDGIKK
jgi:AcrR family transcriptional regulator